MDESADLLIELFHQAGDQYIVRLQYYQPGAGAEPAPSSGIAGFGETTLQELRRTFADPESHGRVLRRVLLVDTSLLAPFRERLDRSRGSTRLRLQIDPTAHELHDLRWETLRDANDQDFLTLDANLPFSRFLYSLQDQDYELRPKAGLRALVLVANPSELSRPGGYTLLTGKTDNQSGTPAGTTLAPVDVAGEVGRVSRAMQEIHLDVLAQYPGSLGRATFENLKNQLRQGFDILYLVCHGVLFTDGVDQPEKPYLLLEKEDGSSDRTKGEELVAYIHDLPVAIQPRLVVLASCQSGGKGKVPTPEKETGETDEEERSYDQGSLAALGPRLVDAGIPAVVAMQYNVKMETARQFMQVFFEELLKLGRVDQAMSIARSFIRRQPDWWVPVLYLRLKSGQLFPPPQPLELSVIDRQPYEPETIYIPAGSFLMGRQSAAGVPGVETPQGEVVLPAYRIGKYPITNSEFLKFIRQTRRPVPPEMAWDGQNPPKGEEEYPVRGVTWFEALEYCQWLSEQTGRKYGLPTEAQWEKAARTQDGRLFPWGDAWQPGRCNQGNRHTAPVKGKGSFDAQNDFGLYDLVGNVLQWTTTLWGEKRLEPDTRFPYPWQDDGRDDLEANKQVRRVLRGSAYTDLPQDCTCTGRRSFLPGDRGQPGKRHGFRVVMSL